MRDLAAELGVDAPALYYHVPGKQAAMDLLAESVLALIPIPETGAWDVRLIELYCAARKAILSVPGTASLLETTVAANPLVVLIESAVHSSLRRASRKPLRPRPIRCCTRTCWAR
jgi:AcrR family transcriptional regulator